MRHWLFHTPRGPTSGGGGTLAVPTLSSTDFAVYDETSVVQAGGAVSAWNDRGVNGQHFTQATSANQPAWNASTKSVQFDGVNDALVTAPINYTAKTASAAFAVMNLATDAGHNKSCLLQAPIDGDDIGASGTFLLATTSNNDELNFYRGGSATLAVPFGSEVRVGAVLSNDGTGADVFYNRSAGTSTSGTYPGAVYTTNEVFVLGGRWNGSGGRPSDFAKFSIRRLIILHFYPTSGDLTAIDTWMQAQTGTVSGDLGADPLYARTLMLPPDDAEYNSQFRLYGRYRFKTALESMTGGTWTMTDVTSPTLGTAAIICVKDAAFSVNPDKYSIKSQGDSLIIRSKSVAGISHGLADFLRANGCRSLMGGSRWDVIPAKADIRIQVDRVEEPDFSSRQYFGTMGYGPSLPPDPTGVFPLSTGQWQERLRYGASIPIGGHMWQGFIDANRSWFDATPNDGTGPVGYARYQGVRSYRGDTTKFNTAYTPAITKFAEFVRDQAVAAQTAGTPPSQIVISCEASDGGAWDEPLGGSNTASDQLWTAVNAAAAAVRTAVPGAMVSCYAYNFHTEPPTFATETNVWVQVIAYGFLQAQAIASGHANDLLITLWGSKHAAAVSGGTGGIGTYDYWDISQFADDILGKMTTELILSRFQTWVDSGVRNMNIESTYSGIVMGPRWFALYEKMWDVAVDATALVTEWHTKAWGPVVTPLRGMMDRWTASPAPFWGYSSSADWKWELALSFLTIQEALDATASGGGTPDAPVRLRVYDMARYVLYVMARMEWFDIKNLPLSTTLDPARTTTGITLSNGGHTATQTADHQRVLVFDGYSTGKHAAKITIGALNGTTDLQIGLADESFVLGTTSGGYIGSDTHSLGFQGDGTLKHNNATSSSGYGTYTTGVDVRLRVDLGARLIWHKIGTANWNGNASANPDTGVGGIAIPSGLSGLIHLAIGFGTKGSGSPNVTVEDTIIEADGWTYWPWNSMQEAIDRKTLGGIIYCARIAQSMVIHWYAMIHFFWVDSRAIYNIIGNESDKPAWSLYTGQYTDADIQGLLDTARGKYIATRTAFSKSFTAASIPSGVTLTRAGTTAGTGPTYTDTSGVLQIASGANTPRFDYHPTSHALLGLLKERARTNYAKFNLDLANAGRLPRYTTGTGTSSTVGASGIGLDGNNTLAKITVNRSDTASWAQGTATGPDALPTSTTMVYSIYLKASRPADVGKQVPLWFFNGLFVSSRVPVTLTDTLTRYWVSGEPSLDQTDVQAGVGYDGESGGVNVLTGEVQFLATGDQFENGTVPSSVIVTQGSAVTVAADDLSFTVPTGIGFLRATFDDDSSQVVEAPAGAYTTPPEFNRPRLKTIGAPS